MWVMIQWWDYPGEGNVIRDIFGPFDSETAAFDWLEANRARLNEDSRADDADVVSYECMSLSSPNIIWPVSDGTRA